MDLTAFSSLTDFVHVPKKGDYIEIKTAQGWVKGTVNWSTSYVRGGVPHWYADVFPNLKEAGYPIDCFSLGWRYGDPEIRAQEEKAASLRAKKDVPAAEDQRQELVEKARLQRDKERAKKMKWSE